MKLMPPPPLGDVKSGRSDNFLSQNVFKHVGNIRVWYSVSIATHL